MNPVGHFLEDWIVAGIIEQPLQVDEVECRQVIEMQDVALQVVGTQNEIAQIESVVRHLQAHGVFDRTAGGDAMADRADPADSLRNHCRIERVASFQEGFEASKHLSFTPGCRDLAVFDLGINA